MCNDILKHQNMVRNNIMKSFGVENSEDSLEKGVEDEINPFEMEAYKSELTKAELDEFEKAKHQDGDMHPNGKWVWRQSANGGKGDWRVAKPSRDGSSSKTTSNKADKKIDLNGAKLSYQSDGTPFALSNAVVGLTKNKFDELKKKYSSLSTMRYNGGNEQQEAVFSAIVSSSESYEDAAKNLNNSGVTYRDWKVDSVNEDYAVLSMKKNNDVYKLVVRPNAQKTSNSKSKTNVSKNKENFSLPEKIKAGETIKVEIGGKEFSIKHIYNKDDEYGQFRIYQNNKQIKMIDYGAGHKFHGYDFPKAEQAYSGVKKFFASKNNK